MKKVRTGGKKNEGNKGERKNERKARKKEIRSDNWY